MHYSKRTLTFDEQMALLRERGLAIDDPVRTSHWLRKISYYRLSAYFLPFKDGERFQPGTEFDQIAGLYIFDRKLRLLVLDAIERIEIAIRTAITYEIAHAHGPFGHTDPANFAPGFDHAKFMEELAIEEPRSKETFVDHFRDKYISEPHLPIWMASELLSFGTISQIYRVLAPGIKQSIAGEYGVDHKFFASWLHALSHVRNICAHHKRLWNRHFGIRPKFPSRSRAWPHQMQSNERLYCILVILQHMLKVVSPRCQWRTRLFALFDQHPGVPLASMQIPDDWHNKAIWR